VAVTVTLTLGLLVVERDAALQLELVVDDLETAVRHLVALRIAGIDVGDPERPVTAPAAFSVTWCRSR
jgi:hypothetical protein